jgi:hypothetical protein
MSSVIVQGNASGSGSVTLASPNTNSTYTATLPARTGNVAMDGPAFSAYAASSQSVTSGTFTKVTLGSEDFDTASCFDTTNSRFTPNVAGYYQISGIVRVSTTSTTFYAASLYKNGSEYIRGQEVTQVSVGGAQQAVVTAIVYFNGTTDYIELWGAATGGTSTFAYASSAITSRFTGAFVRGA